MLRHEKETALQASAAAQVEVQPRFFRLPPAVKYSGINRTAMYDLLSSEKIKSHLIGGSRVIDRVSIDEYISSQPSKALNPRIRGRGGRRALETVPA